MSTMLNQTVLVRVVRKAFIVQCELLNQLNAPLGIIVLVDLTDHPLAQIHVPTEHSQAPFH